MKQKIEDHILQRCEIVVEDASTLPQEEFAMIRRQGLGASDASVYLGLQSKWRTTEDLIQNKLQKEYTEEEAEVGKKIVVRMGNACEPLTLALFTEHTGIPLIKPTQMFRYKEVPWLTVNYDGVGIEYDTIIPVEAKYVSFYGDKYYNWNKSNQTNTDPEPAHDNIVDYCTAVAASIGIPPYYYAQVQHQLLTLGAPYGYLVALRSKTSEIGIFRVAASNYVQHSIILEGSKVWHQIERQRK
jgi:predicted phage-related endonuclease